MLGSYKDNETAAKEATDMRLFYTGYYLIISRTRNSEWQREWENGTSKLLTLNLALKSRKAPIS